MRAAGTSLLIACACGGATSPNTQLVGGTPSNDETVVRVEAHLVGGPAESTGVLVGTGTGVILTAAHAVLDRSSNEVAAESITLSNNDVSWEVVPTDVRIVSPVNRGDLAVIYGANLNQRPNATLTPRSVAAPIDEPTFKSGGGLLGQTVTAIGFGQTDPNDPGSALYQFTGTETISAIVVDHDDPSLYPAAFEVVRDSAIACHGDSGGPALLGDVVAGIAIQVLGPKLCSSGAIYTSLGRMSAVLAPYLDPGNIPAPSDYDTNASAYPQPRSLASTSCDGTCGDCGADVCDADPTGACTCLAPLPSCPSDCGDCGSGVCVLDDQLCATCQPAAADPTDPCQGTCDSSLQTCAVSLGGTECLFVDPCSGPCAAPQSCVENADATWGCQ